ncbi:MAG TPA: hypothetical protein VK096_00100 [Actinomycetales bacterium]|nr:hypothetical protein [Actinomycetales bacterium]
MFISVLLIAEKRTDRPEGNTHGPKGTAHGIKDSKHGPEGNAYRQVATLIEAETAFAGEK